jgi:hypothetical protein
MKERGTIGHSVVGYFRSKEEVSALYVASRSSGEVSFALLLKDARLFGRSLEHLRAEYFSAVKSIISGPLNIVFLNTAPPSERYWILSTWDLLLDRNRNYRCWFAEASTNEYFGSTPGARVRRDTRNRRKTLTGPVAVGYDRHPRAAAGGRCPREFPEPGNQRVNRPRNTHG